MRFGEAYGFTTVVVAPEGEPSDGRPHWNVALDALRTFILKIESHADPEIEGTKALAAFLLGTYVELVDDLAKNRRPGRSAKTGTAPATPPAAGGTP